jgi:hypothetical protein
MIAVNTFMEDEARFLLLLKSNMLIKFLHFITGNRPAIIS